MKKREVEARFCRKCVLNDSFPGVSFSDDGVCNFCEDALDSERLAEHKERLFEALEQTIKDHKGQGAYDCIVAYSGGKDSTYTLKLMVEQFGLNCLAVTIDNGFVSERAEKNIKAVTDALGVDFMLFKPNQDFMFNMYRKSITIEGIRPPAAIKRASDICSSCINLINNYMIKLALKFDVNLIAGGYIGGQVPKDANVLKLNLSKREKMNITALQRTVSHFGEESKKYFSLAEDLNKSNQERQVHVLNPLIAINISEEDIIKNISPLGWERTRDTGLNSSNCLLNDFGIAAHSKKYGFHPYAYEISEQVRNGLMSRAEALKKIESVPTFKDVGAQMRKLGISESDVK